MYFVVGKTGISYNKEKRRIAGAEAWEKTG